MNGIGEKLGTQEKHPERHTYDSKVPAPETIVNAESIYKALTECRSMAQEVFEIQVSLNDKLINAPTETGEKAKAAGDRAENPRHIPNWFDKIQDIIDVTHSTLCLQQHLFKHF